MNKTERLLRWLNEPIGNGCGAVGPEGYRCTHHENGEHVARGTEPGSFAEAWPILDEIRRRERRKLKRQQAFNVALISATACVWLAVIALVVEILGRV